MADAVIAPSATTRLRYQFTVDGAVSDVPTVTATETEPDGTINNLSNPTLQNDPADPSYILDYSNADEGDYYVKFLTSDTNCDQYPGVAFYVTVQTASGGASAADIADAVLDEALSGHVSAGSAGYALGLIDDVKTKTDAIGTSAAYALSPTIAANTVRIVRGDSYLAANGRSIRLTYSGQPDFTSATNVTLKAVKGAKHTGTTILTLTGTVYSSDTLEFQPDTVDTSGTELSTTSATQLVFPMEVSLILSNGKVITPTSLNVGLLKVDQQAP